jgi:hypothetical protein
MANELTIANAINNVIGANLEGCELVDGVLTLYFDNDEEISLVLRNK